MIRAAISEFEYSRLCFHFSKALDGDLYKKECIRRLVPFFKNSLEDNRLFLSDLACFYRAETVLDELQRNDINFFLKNINPSYPHQRCPIENFWSMQSGLLQK